MKILINNKIHKKIIMELYINITFINNKYFSVVFIIII